MLHGVLSGGIGMAPVLTLDPEDIKAVIVHFTGVDGEDDIRAKVAQVELTAWRGQVMGFFTNHPDSEENFYADEGRVLVAGGRLVTKVTHLQMLQSTLQMKNPTLVFPLRLGRSSSFYASNAHLTLTKKGAEAFAVWLDKCLELGVL